MRILIDGHNAMYALLGDDDEGSHEERRRRLLARIRTVRPSAIVYFDARRAPRHLAPTWSEGGVRVVYCPDREADAQIHEDVLDAKHPRDYLVVTNDRGLAERVTAAGAQHAPILPFLALAPREDAAEKPEDDGFLWRPEDFDLPEEVDLDDPRWRR